MISLKKMVKNIQDNQIKDYLKNMLNFNPKYQLQKSSLINIIYHLKNTEEEDIKHIEFLFKVFDKNCLGMINLSDIKRGFSRILSTPEEELFNTDDFFKKIDSGNGFIQCKDFVMSTISKRKILGENMIKESFNYFDINNKGKVSLEDLKIIFKNIAGDKLKELIKEVTNKDFIIYDDFAKAMRELIIG